MTQRFQRASLLRALALAAILLPGTATADPTNYQITSGMVTSITVGFSGPCPIGGPVPGCVVNAPLAIDFASITIDTQALLLNDLDIFLSGPGVLALGGINGLQTAVFSDTSFSGAGTLFASGGQFNFAAPGTVDVGTLDLFALGNGTAVPDFSAPISTATTPTGFIVLSNGQMDMSLFGVELGAFVDPLSGAQAIVKADFQISAAVPEPSAALAFSVGALIVIRAVKRRPVAIA